MVLLLFFVILLIIGVEIAPASDRILPWESYLKLGEVQRPFGLELNHSSLLHQHFAIGHLALHSFMYDAAQDAFNLALSIEPTFIEAHIGKILGCKHPLWSDTDFDCGLTSYNAALLATANASYSSLQSDLLSTAYIWYSNLSSVTSGEEAFLSSMANLTEKYPNETDILVWYGLSLLNVAKQTVFESEIEPKAMIKAREILGEAFIREPHHPGALHYLIHAYDVARSDIAEQGRKYAISYSNIGETASHAQHMASHIWVRTGETLQIIAHLSNTDRDMTTSILSKYLTFTSCRVLSNNTQFSSVSLEYVTSRQSCTLVYAPNHVFSGYWLAALSSDATAIRASLGLCVTRIADSIRYIHSIQLEPVLSEMNGSNQTLALLACDTINRAHSNEWLTYTCMQVGDISCSQTLISDLFLAHNRSTLITTQYLLYAYLARTLMLVDFFYWLPYSEEFFRVAQQLYTFDNFQSMFMFGNDTSDWFPSWAEAAYRLGDSLRILAGIRVSNHSTLHELSQVDDHLLRLETLSNQTTTLSRFVSLSISLMIPQIRAIRYFVNGSLEACLADLNKATAQERILMPDNNSPYHLFFRSSELLALHLLLMYQEQQNTRDQQNILTADTSSNRTLSIRDFPAMALSHYQNASAAAPNRTINTIGLARANAQLGKYGEAGRFYQLLRDRMLSANVKNNSIIEEANSFFIKHPITVNDALKSETGTFLLFISLCFLHLCISSIIMK